MAGIDRVGPGVPGVVGPRAARVEAGAAFALPDAAAADAAAAGSVAAGSAVAGSGPAGSASAAAAMAVESWLALQAVDEGNERDRAARRRGQALLGVLGRVQLGLLGGDDPAGALAELRRLVADVPVAWDAGLAAAVDHVVLRARLELARRHG